MDINQHVRFYVNITYFSWFMKLRRIFQRVQSARRRAASCDHRCWKLWLRRIVRAMTFNWASFIYWVEAKSLTLDGCVTGDPRSVWLKDENRAGFCFDRDSIATRGQIVPSLYGLHGGTCQQKVSLHHSHVTNIAICTNNEMQFYRPREANCLCNFRVNWILSCDKLGRFEFASLLDRRAWRRRV